MQPGTVGWRTVQYATVTGDLVELDHQLNGLWPEEYAIRRLVTTKLRTRGRFVRFLILPGPGSPYTFVDEIEVFRGPAELMQGEPGCQPVGDVKELFARWRIECGVRRRFEADIAGVGEAIRKADLADEAVRRRLLAQWELAGKALHWSTVEAIRSIPTRRRQKSLLARLRYT